MDEKHFDQLVKGVGEMRRHMAGRPVRGARTTELAEPALSGRNRRRGDCYRYKSGPNS